MLINIVFTIGFTFLKPLKQISPHNFLKKKIMNSKKQGTKRRRERRCSYCNQTNHIRTACPALVGLEKYQKRGTDHYWNKKGQLKWFSCVLGNRITNNTEMDWCWSQRKCPECFQVRLMGLELKKIRFLKDYNDLPDHCKNCDDRYNSLSEAEGHTNGICPKKTTHKQKRNKKTESCSSQDYKCSFQGCEIKSDLIPCDGCGLPFCRKHRKGQHTSKFDLEIHCKRCGGIYY